VRPCLSLVVAVARTAGRGGELTAARRGIISGTYACTHHVYGMGRHTAMHSGCTMSYWHAILYLALLRGGGDPQYRIVLLVARGRAWRKAAKKARGWHGNINRIVSTRTPPSLPRGASAAARSQTSLGVWVGRGFDSPSAQRRLCSIWNRYRSPRPCRATD